MNKRNFKFYLAITQSLDTTLGWSISDAGAIAPARDRAMAAVRHTKLEGEGLRVDLPFTDPYSAVFFYDANKQLLSMTQLKGSDLIIAPAGSEYYAIRLTTYDPAVRGATSTGVFKVVHAIYEVSPYYKKLEKRMTKDSGQNYYRESLSGQLKLVGKDFDLIYGRGIDRSFGLFIYLGGKRYFNGSFSKIDCKFDIVKKICEPKIKTSDSYTRILDRYEDKYDLVKMKLPLDSIGCSKRAFMQIYCLGANTVTNVFNGQAWETEVSIPVESIDDVTKAGFSGLKYFREIAITHAGTESVKGLYTEIETSQESVSGAVILELKVYKVDKGVRTHYIQVSVRATTGAASGQAGIYSVGSPSEPLYTATIGPDIGMLMANEKGSLRGLAFTSTSDTTDKLVIAQDFLYDIYGRIVHSNTNTGEALDSNDFAMSNVSYKRVSPLEVQASDILQSSDSTTESTIYGINDYGEYFTPEFLPEPSSGSKYLPIARSSWANTSIWLAYNSDLVGRRDQQFYLRDCLNIGHVIKGLLSKIGSSVMHEPLPEYSSFLYADKQPLPGIARFYVYITQKSNAVRGTYDQAAQKAEVSLKTIMDMLRDCFRCYWYIEDRKLKIEHISFFKNGLSYVPDSSCTDLTLLNDKYNGKPVLYGQGPVEYDMSEFSRKYNLAYSGKSQVPFSGVSLEVDADYVQADKVEDINVDEFSADLDYMQISADSVSQDGFALLCPTYVLGWGDIPVTTKVLALDNTEIPLIDNGKAYKTKIQNPYASWAYLARLYSFDMPGERITSNVLEPFTASGLKEGLLQTVLIPEVPGLRPYDAVKTDLGTARIKSVSENLDSGYMTLELAYPLG